MMSFLKKLFGVSEAPLVGGLPSGVVTRAMPQYLPENRVPDGAIDGVSDDGACFQFWRTDASGKNWYRRISNGDVPANPGEIHGFAPTSGDDEEDDSLPDDVAAGQLLLRQLMTGDYEAPADPEAARENARLRMAARRYQGRMENWPQEDDSALEESDSDD